MKIEKADPERQPAKRPYSPPTLTRYGDVAALTMNRFTGGKNDKGTGFKTRTR